MFRVALVSTLIFLTVVAFTNAKILFVDDFEDDTIGKEPSKWDKLDFASGNAVITVEKDPTDGKNKAAKTVGIGLYIPKADGREQWRDYIWDFDWMWLNDSFVGTIYRVEGGIDGAESHFHGSRRTGAVNVQIYTRKAGGWNLVGTGQFPNENEVWYHHRLVMKGGTHEIYLRERGKELPPSDWHVGEDPVVEVDNDEFKTGPVGMMGITTGTSFFDNMVVVETVADIDRVRPVSPRGRLTTVWGAIKAQP